jgi:hypothetical protein
VAPLKAETSLDWAVALLAAACGAMALWQFAVGQHYIIPTAWLVPTFLFGNVARYGLAGARWAKEVLLWIGVIWVCHTFFALFFAQTPRALLGAAFEPVCGVVFLASAWLVVRYARGNGLLRRPGA